MLIFVSFPQIPTYAIRPQIWGSYIAWCVFYVPAFASTKYTAWWQGCMSVNNLPRVIMQLHPCWASNRVRSPAIMPPCHPNGLFVLILVEISSFCNPCCMPCQCGYLSGARCRLLAYGPADPTAIPKPRHLLPHLNSDWFYLSGTGLSKLSWKRGR